MLGSGFFHVKEDWTVIPQNSYPQGGLTVDGSLFSLLDKCTVTEKEIVTCMSLCRVSLFSKENNQVCFL